jgi:hypothetical protein
MPMTFFCCGFLRGACKGIVESEVISHCKSDTAAHPPRIAIGAINPVSAKDLGFAGQTLPLLWLRRQATNGTWLSELG